jgi:hypothetical protein
MLREDNAAGRAAREQPLSREAVLEELRAVAIVNLLDQVAAGHARGLEFDLSQLTNALAAGFHNLIMDESWNHPHPLPPCDNTPPLR